MKRLTYLKALALSCAVMACCMLPHSLNAQHTDGFFRGVDDGYEFRDYNTFVYGGGIQPGGVGEVPLGSGLLVLTIAGAGYAVARRRRRDTSNASNHVATMMLMAAVMLLGLTQCKKKSDTLQTVVANGGTPIVLNVEPESRVIVDPNNPVQQDDHWYAPVTFENGDVIYVGYDNKFVGTLSYSETTHQFSGNIDIAPEDAVNPLNLYLLGGNGFTPVQNGNIFTVDISEQTNRYPVIEYAVSRYVNGEHHAKFTSKCSIMKFNVTKPNRINSNYPICIAGMNNLVTVNFADPTGADNGFSYSQTNGGVITMPGSTNPGGYGTGTLVNYVNIEKSSSWAIVLPQDAIDEEGADGTIFDGNGACKGKRPALDAILPNKYLDAGVEMAMTYPGFVVNESSQKCVYFAPGNLQYNAASQTWRFAEHQWDFVGTQHPSGTQPSGGNVLGSDNYNISETYDGWIDLFGWGTSGWDNGNTYYKPTDYLYVNSASNGMGYGPIGSYSLTDSYANADWGVYNSSVLGNSWYTLPYVEWIYIFKARATLQGKTQGKNLYTLATVNDVCGAIIFPDNWDGMINGNEVAIVYKNEPGGAIGTGDRVVYTDNVFSESTAVKWSEMEAKGVIFLPAAGMRTCSSNSPAVFYTGTQGWYWTNENNGTRQADYEIISDQEFHATGSGSLIVYHYNGANLEMKHTDRNWGMSVRLVRDAN